MNPIIEAALKPFAPVQSPAMSKDRKEIYISDRLRKLMLVYPMTPLTKTVNVMADRYVALLDTQEFSEALIYAVAFVLRKREQQLSAADIPLLPAMVRQVIPDCPDLAQLEALDYRGLLALVIKAELTGDGKPHPRV